MTLVFHSQPLWRGFTHGGVAPVFPFGASPYLCQHEDHCTSHAKPPHSRTRILVPPLRERLPGCNLNWVRVLQCKGGKMGGVGVGCAVVSGEVLGVHGIVVGVVMGW